MMSMQTRTKLVNSIQTIGEPSISRVEYNNVIVLRNEILKLLSTVERYQQSVEQKQSVIRRPHRIEVVKRCAGAVWDISDHPMKELFDMRISNDKVNDYCDVVLKRPQEFPLETKPNQMFIHDKEIKAFDCEYLWRLTRYCVGRKKLFENFFGTLFCVCVFYDNHCPSFFLTSFVGSHPLVGVVSRNGVLPNVNQGIFEQRPGEFGMSIDVESSTICLIYNDRNELNSIVDEMSLKERRRSTGEHNNSRALSPTSIRKSSRLERQSEDYRSREGRRRSSLQLSHCTTSESELISNEPFIIQFHGVTMVHPIRIVVDRLHNKILGFTPMSPIHFEINIPQLSQIQGPVVPMVSFMSGGFRGYFGHSHPAFSPTVEEFLEEYLGKGPKEGQKANSRKKSLPATENLKERESTLVLFNPSLIASEYLKLWPSMKPPAVEDETQSRAVKGRGRRSNFMRGVDPLVENQSVGFIMSMFGGTKTIMKYQKLSVQQTQPGAPRRPRRPTQLLVSSNPPTPPNELSISASSGFTMNPYQDYHRNPFPEVTRPSLLTASTTLARTLRVPKGIRRTKLELGLHSGRKIKKTRIRKTGKRGSGSILTLDQHNVTHSSRMTAVGTLVGTSGNMMDDGYDDDLLGLGGTPLPKGRRSYFKKRVNDDEDDWNPTHRSLVPLSKLKKKKKKKKKKNIC